MKQAIITVDLGFGDAGKGATVDFLCRRMEPSLVVRYSGGSQCAHTVIQGEHKHTFAQFGSGTFQGIPTYLGPNVIVHPEALVNEAIALSTILGPRLPQLHIDARCLITTEFHRKVNQFKEMTRGLSRHGSCGHGIGETRAYWKRYGTDAIIYQDLYNPNTLRDKLELLRQRKIEELAAFLDQEENQMWRDGIFRNHVNHLWSISSKDLVQTMTRVLKWSSITYTHPEVHGLAIYEGAQGVLLDEWEGFFPYVTHSTVTARHALDLIDELGVDEFTVLGITRAYMTRHGAGPLPSQTNLLRNKLNDPNNPHNPWQEDMRFGALDLPLLRYAVQIAANRLWEKNQPQIDGLVVNHLDEVKDGGLVIQAYPEQINPAPIPSLEYQKKLTKLLFGYQTQDHHPVPMPPDRILSLLDEIAPIVIKGYGPTALHRNLTEGNLKWRALPRN